MLPSSSAANPIRSRKCSDFSVGWFSPRSRSTLRRAGSRGWGQNPSRKRELPAGSLSPLTPALSPCNAGGRGGKVSYHPARNCDSPAILLYIQPDTAIVTLSFRLPLLLSMSLTCTGTRLRPAAFQSIVHLAATPILTEIPMTAAAQGTPSGPNTEEQTKSMIRGVVLRSLKQSNRGDRIQVHLLWDNHYRVNVLVGDAAIQLSIAKSYFLVVDAAGNIVASTPAIVAA
jgi:hypothetical protein